MSEPSPSTLVVEFAARLRAAGLVVPVGAVVVFSKALSLLGLDDPEQVYWAARATLTCHLEDRVAFDRAFAEVFSTAPEENKSPVAAPESVVEGEPGGEQEEGLEDERTRRRSYSHLERLRREDFSSYDQSDWEEADRLFSMLRTNPASRLSRRLRPSSLKGRLDLERTVRTALRNDGEAMLDSYKRRSARPRRLVFLLDISGSMEPYAHAFLRLAHAATQLRGGGVETFALGTRVTRLTQQLAWREQKVALSLAGAAAQDWYGGTRLGEGLRFFLDRWGQRGLARGAVVVVLSDGWDRGDPLELGQQMARLSRLCYRLIWVNPLRATPGYEPIAAGMAAALPHVDDFVDGHSIEALERLLVLITAHGRSRSSGSIVPALT